MKKTFNKIATSVLAFFLISCGSNQADMVETQLSTGVSVTTKSTDFGKAASAKDIAAMSAKLGTYFNGKNASNPQALIGSIGSKSATASVNTGSTATPMIAASNVASPVFRFYNVNTGAHFFTMSTAERDYVKNTFPFFTFEGNSFFAYPDSDSTLSPVYRFYNKVTGTHFFTISPEEKAYVQATWPTIFNFEGISWYASADVRTGWVPVYRFFNTKTSTHFYTTSAAERDYVLATWNWFTFEGIAYYVGESATEPVVVPPEVPDITAPVITVLGTNPLSLYTGTAYTEAGATCTDDKDTTCSIITTGSVNTATAGTYTITYTATDAAGNTSSKTRSVTVEVAPILPCTAAATGSTGYSLVFKGCDANNVATYYAKDECVRDNATGLIWQGQTAAGTGLRANDQYKTNFDSTTELQKWKGTWSGPGGTLSAALDFVAPTAAQVNASTNSIGYKNDVNATNLCGSGAWRLPTKDELLSIVKTTEYPTIDSTWFPNTVDWSYWTSSTYAGGAYYVWGVNFYDGNARYLVRDYYGFNYYSLVRLVR